VSSELTLFITHYGYAAIFLLVLLQELGVPNPVMNEFVLLFSGYLAYTGVLNLWLVLVAAVSADCIGTTILYAVFYMFGAYLMDRRPKWFPVKPSHIEQIKHKIAERQQWGIYLGRLMPFLRGYCSVAAGILSIKPGIFIPAVIVSAITWSGGYVVAGRLLGPYWEQVATRIGNVQKVALLLTAILIVMLVRRAVVRRSRQPI
jgi:membrane protein DedA with SNARE-associated domain